MRVPLRVANPENGVEPVEIGDAVIDTGSTHTVLPRAIANHIRLEKFGRRRVLTANGLQTLDQSYATLRLQGEEIMFPVVISDSIPTAIVGVTLLEVLGFIIDPVREEIRPTDTLLL